MEDKELRRYLNVIKRAVSIIEGALDIDDDGILEKIAHPDSPIVIQQPVAIESQPIQAQPVLVQEQRSEPVQDQPEEVQERTPQRKAHIKQLLEIDCWPEAVLPFLAEKVPTEEDQIKRANSVLDTMLTVSAEGKSFLDFGCFEGWIAQQAMKRGMSESVGYDIVKCEDWEKRDGAIYTDNFQDIADKKFDIIMLYDVLDHAHDPVGLMSQVKQCLSPDGHVYVRCHPWTSLHANHIYKKGVNKAFIHLFLHWDELEELIGEEPMFTRPEISPIEAYNWWFNDFKIIKERKIKGPVSEFFFVPAFRELIANEQGIAVDQMDAFLDLMQIQFVDYHLENK